MAVALLSGCSPAEAPQVDGGYLEAAIAAGRFLQAESADGMTGGVSDELSDTTVTATLGTGAAGRVLFFIELYAETGDSTFLQSARTAIAAVPHPDPSPSEGYGLYNGLAGIAFALAEVAAVSGDSSLASDAERLFRGLLDAGAASTGWGDINDVLAGRAGIGLALLYAYEEFGDPSYLAGAVRAGDQLMGLAETMSGNGLRWMRGESMPLDLPNFSHGTAGVGFFLARLGRLSGADRFVEGAKRAADYLESISDQPDRLFLVPYGMPNEGWSTPFDIGWAHGPAGTARLHYELWRQTGNVQMRDRVDAQAAAILASGVPGPSRDETRWVGPFPIDRRFGGSGAASFLIDWGRVAQSQTYLEGARRISEAILHRGTSTDRGLYWTVPRYGFQGGEGTGVFTGYFYGVAGLGLTLLHQHYAETDEWPVIRLPDDPFPRRERHGVQRVVAAGSVASAAEKKILGAVHRTLSARRGT